MMDFYGRYARGSPFYARWSLSPSYLNRQPYGFLVQDHSIYLVQQEDAYTDNSDAALDLGIVMGSTSAAVASQWAGQVRWELSTCCARTALRGRTSLRCGVAHM
ncbi:hypothetical protein [Faecalibacterium sp.]|uniref:hypothetical protein n=1 Tax=Faecalibacterium sp. TaxID=1971605 RepID=UPI003526E70C